MLQRIYHWIIDVCRKYVFNSASRRVAKRERKMKKLLKEMNAKYIILEEFLKAGGYNRGQRKEFRRQITKGTNLFKE